jgi:hypothetical protein
MLGPVASDTLGEPVAAPSLVNPRSNDDILAIIGSGKLRRYATT